MSKKRVVAGFQQDVDVLDYLVSLQPHGPAEPTAISELNMRACFKPLRDSEGDMSLPEEGDIVREGARRRKSRTGRPFSQMRFIGGSMWTSMVKKISGDRQTTEDRRRELEVKIGDNCWIPWHQLESGLFIHTAKELGSVSASDAKALLDHFDSDSNQKLDQAELEQFLASAAAIGHNNSPSKLPGPSMKTAIPTEVVHTVSYGRMASEMVEKLDKNHDGKLDKGELKRGFSTLLAEAEKVNALEDVAEKTESKQAKVVKRVLFDEAAMQQIPKNEITQDRERADSQGSPKTEDSKAQLTAEVEDAQAEAVILEVKDVTGTPAYKQVLAEKQQALGDCMQLRRQVEDMSKARDADMLKAKEDYVAKEEYDLLQQQVQNMSKEKEEYIFLQQQVADLSTAKEECVRLQEQVNDMSKEKEEYIILQQQLGDLSKARLECTRLQEQVNDMSKEKQDYALLQQQVNDLSQAKEECMILQQQVVELSTAKDECVSLQRQLNDLSQSKEESVLLYNVKAEEVESWRKQYKVKAEESEQLHQKLESMSTVAEEVEKLKQQLMEAEKRAAAAATVSREPPSVTVYEPVPATASSASASSEKPRQLPTSVSPLPSPLVTKPPSPRTVQKRSGSRTYADNPMLSYAQKASIGASAQKPVTFRVPGVAPTPSYGSPHVVKPATTTYVPAVPSVPSTSPMKAAVRQTSPTYTSMPQTSYSVRSFVGAPSALDQSLGSFNEPRMLPTYAHPAPIQSYEPALGT